MEIGFAFGMLGELGDQLPNLADRSGTAGSDPFTVRLHRLV